MNRLKLIEDLLAVRNSPMKILEIFQREGLTLDQLRDPVSQCPTSYPYSREVLVASSECELMLARWSPDRVCAPHDHGEASGWVFFLAGRFHVQGYRWDGHGLLEGEALVYEPGSYVAVMADEIHSCHSEGPGLSLHVYFPRVRSMRVFDLAKRQTLTVADDCGAWVPEDSAQIQKITPWPLPASIARTILILYTTLYREGGTKFERAATTLEEEKRREFPNHRIVRKAVESKRAFVAELEKLGHDGAPIAELHFIGHSGMYGIMFGTTKWPEQMSPYEWRHQKIAFASEAKVFFHACRTARWFAPFFARTFGVRAFGHFWYTTVSRAPGRFSWDAFTRESAPLYIISVPGKKSHGLLLGTFRKYFLRPASFPMLEFEPKLNTVDTTYDSVAALYDETFEDIAVREDELHWLRKKIAALPEKPRVLDIGCGTGSFLRAIRDLSDSADGVDLSAGMIDQAKRRSPDDSRLRYTKIDGPSLPFADESFDVVTSVLSFRYLDWDPILKEILRVLKPGGKFMVIDMVAAPLKLAHWPYLLRDKIKQRRTLRKYPEYARTLSRMVGDPRWKRMLEFNPIRSEHEMIWYLESRLPEGDLEIINYGWHSRVLAFQSAPIFDKTAKEISYP